MTLNLWATFTLGSIPGRVRLDFICKMQAPINLNSDSWPDLVGKTYDEAASVIQKDRPDVQVVRVPEGSMVTMDYRPDRVRITVNEEDKVVVAPRTG